MVNEENPFAGALKKKKKWPPDPVGEEAPRPAPARPGQKTTDKDGLIKSGINVLEKVVGRDLDGDTDIAQAGAPAGKAVTTQEALVNTVAEPGGA